MIIWFNKCFMMNWHLKPFLLVSEAWIACDWQAVNKESRYEHSRETLGALFLKLLKKNTFTLYSHVLYVILIPYIRVYNMKLMAFIVFFASMWGFQMCKGSHSSEAAHRSKTGKLMGVSEYWRFEFCAQPFLLFPE